MQNKFLHVILNETRDTPIRELHHARYSEICIRNSMESAYNNKYHDSIIRNTGNYDINNMSVEVKIKTLSIHVQFTPAD